MDYKEKYEKALGWMREMYPTFYGAIKEDAEHFFPELAFPELAESEDEIVRKRLVDYFESLRVAHITTRWEGLDIQSIIAYLEKQKPHNPTDEDEKVRKELIVHLQQEANSATLEANRAKWKKMLNWVEKQKEQKPIAWTEEDEKIRKALIKGLNFLTTSERIFTFGDIPIEDIVAYLEKHTDYLSTTRVETFPDGTTVRHSIGYLEKGEEQQQEKKEVKFVFPKFLYARTTNNKTIDVSYAPQSLDAVEYIRSDYPQQEQKPVGCIEFDNEFKNQVSHLLVSVLNKDWEYDKGFVEYAAQQLLGYAKHEIQPADQGFKGRRGRIGITPKHIREKAENFLSKMEPPYDADDICSAYETGAMENANPSWSEEDERMLERAIHIIAEYSDIDEKESEIVQNWLNKFLRLRPKQEWSEEDEKNWRLVLDGIRDCELRCWFYSVWERLAYLKPHWKPSDEDEERLINTSISFLKDFADKGYENAVECIDWLKSKLNGNSGK